MSASSIADAGPVPPSSPNPDIAAAIARGNVVCFLDVAVGGGSSYPSSSSSAGNGGGTPLGRIRLELFKGVCPRTVENFRQLCCGEFRPSHFPLGYKDTTFHRVIQGFMIQGGDFVNRDGTGSESIYGTKFEDENFTIKHDKAGMLSSANNGKDTNGCQFFITCAATPWLDGKHVCFGKVLDEESMRVVRMIEAVRVSQNKKRPEIDITITQCGEL